MRLTQDAAVLKAADTHRGGEKQGRNLSCVRTEGMALEVKNKAGTVEGSSLRDEVRGRTWGKVGGRKRPCMRV